MVSPHVISIVIHSVVGNSRFAFCSTGWAAQRREEATDCITNHWTRGETATLLSRNLLSLMLHGGGFARVSSIVIQSVE